MFRAIMLTGIVVWAAAGVCSAFSHLYLYPGGPKPPGVPPDSSDTTSIVVQAWQDARVDGNEPSFMFGADEMAVVEAAAGGRMAAHLLCSFTSVYDVISTPIQSAELRLYAAGASGAAPMATLAVARVLAPWDEQSVTYDTLPAAGAASAGFAGVAALDAYVAIDIQAAVEAERLAGGRHGVCIAADDDAALLFFTKESSVAAYRPYVYMFIPEPSLWGLACVCLALRRRAINAA